MPTFTHISIPQCQSLRLAVHQKLVSDIKCIVLSQCLTVGHGQLPPSLSQHTMHCPALVTDGDGLSEPPPSPSQHTMHCPALVADGDGLSEPPPSQSQHTMHCPALVPHCDGLSEPPPLPSHTVKCSDSASPH